MKEYQIFTSAGESRIRSEKNSSPESRAGDLNGHNFQAFGIEYALDPKPVGTKPLASAKVGGALVLSPFFCPDRPVLA
jgi:hypothetical protein